MLPSPRNEPPASLEGLPAQAVFLLFALTLFGGSCLLFMVEPMFAKMVLPLLGGTPAVWNTCLLFFQAALLAGYAYAHLSSRWLGLRGGIVLHLALLLLPLAVLPIVVPAGWQPPSGGSPVGWLLLLLTVAVGLPFFVVAAGAPLLQKWFSFTGHPQAADPYFLYAASNFGSLVGLLGYVAGVEPLLALPEQSDAWRAGYLALAALTAGCGIVTLRYGRRAAVEPMERESALEGEGTVPLPDEPLRPARVGRWLALAFIPSSLLLGVTTSLSTDIAAVPLLWVVPLSLYLVTFMLAFARRPWVSDRLFARVLPILVLVQVIVLVRTHLPLPLQVALHLLTFFSAALACHAALARDRPAPRHLTAFYLLLSAGGALGGIFNGLLAPVLFNQVLEYPLVLILACLVVRLQTGVLNRASAAPKDGLAEDTGTAGPSRAAAGARREAQADFIWPLVVGLLGVAMLRVAHLFRLGGQSDTMTLLYGVLALAVFTLSERPVRFTLAMLAAYLVVLVNPGAGTQTLHQQRTFFGVLRVVRKGSGSVHQLWHGTTLHGVQRQEPGWRDEPLAYYTRTGPVGQLLQDRIGTHPGKRLAVIGLGTGSLAAYAGKGQSLTFYEIDPEVLRIASLPKFFRFIDAARRTRGADVRFVLGDARLKLADAPDGVYDVIAVDAFSSDAIPLHLITREALALYRRKLAPGGVLAFHVSNRHLDLQPVLGILAADAGLVCFARADQPSAAEEDQGHWASDWVVLARREDDLGSLARDNRWVRVPAHPGRRLWTDDYSNILGVLRRP